MSGMDKRSQVEGTFRPAFARGHDDVEGAREKKGAEGFGGGGGRKQKRERSGDDRGRKRAASPSSSRRRLLARSSLLSAIRSPGSKAAGIFYPAGVERDGMHLWKPRVEAQRDSHFLSLISADVVGRGQSQRHLLWRSSSANPIALRAGARCCRWLAPLALVPESSGRVSLCIAAEKVGILWCDRKGAGDGAQGAELAQVT